MSTRSKASGPVVVDLREQYEKLEAATKGLAQRNEPQRATLNNKGAIEVIEFLVSIPSISGNVKFHECMGSVFNEALDAKQSIQDVNAWMKYWKLNYVIASQSKGGLHEELTPKLLKHCTSLTELCRTSIAIETKADDESDSERKLLDMYTTILDRLSVDRTTENQSEFDAAFVQNDDSLASVNLLFVTHGDTVEGFWRSQSNTQPWTARIRTVDERSWIEYYDGKIEESHFDVESLTLTIADPLQKMRVATLQHPTEDDCSVNGDGTLVWVVEEGDCSHNWYRTQVTKPQDQANKVTINEEEEVQNSQAMKEAKAKKEAAKRLLTDHASKEEEVSTNWSPIVGDLVKWVSTIGELFTR